jgi:hypothetical protein
MLLLGPLVAWTAEFITAAAWRNPPYSPRNNWVSHLGLTGPAQTAFEQVGNHRRSHPASSTPRACRHERQR